jgi:hypothetical protein
MKLSASEREPRAPRGFNAKPFESASAMAHAMGEVNAAVGSASERTYATLVATGMIAQGDVMPTWQKIKAPWEKAQEYGKINFSQSDVRLAFVADIDTRYKSGNGRMATEWRTLLRTLNVPSARQFLELSRPALVAMHGDPKKAAAAKALRTLIAKAVANTWASLARAANSRLEKAPKGPDETPDIREIVGRATARDLVKRITKLREEGYDIPDAVLVAADAIVKWTGSKA